MYMRHHIMSSALLFLCSKFHLLFIQGEVRAHLFNGLVRDWQTQLLLGDGEVEPQLTPRPETHGIREKVRHFFAGITTRQR